MTGNLTDGASCIQQPSGPPNRVHTTLEALPARDALICQLALLPDQCPARWARHQTRLFLRGFGVYGEHAHGVELAVGELAANAESHTTPPWQLRAYRSADALWLAIADPDLRTAWTVLRRLRAPLLPSNTAQTCGRGLFLVTREFPDACWVRPVSLGADGTQGKEILLCVPLTTTPA